MTASRFVAVLLAILLTAGPFLVPLTGTQRVYCRADGIDCRLEIDWA